MDGDFPAVRTELLELEPIRRLGFIFFGVIVNVVALGAFKMDYRSGSFFLGHLIFNYTVFFLLIEPPPGILRLSFPSRSLSRLRELNPGPFPYHGNALPLS